MSQQPEDTSKQAPTLDASTLTTESSITKGNSSNSKIAASLNMPSTKKATTATAEGDNSQKEAHSLVEQTDPAYAILSALSKAELLDRVVTGEKKLEQAWERLLRLQAETDNAAKRAERDLANAHKFALERFVQALLPVVDSLELSLSSVPEQAEKTGLSTAVIDGIALTLQMLYGVMQKFDIQQLNPVSELFNPEYHQATAIQENTAIPSGRVVSVLQKGYLLSGRLIRAALVVVSK